jgi:hypothetical protein
VVNGRAAPRLAWAVAATVAGCAATGVTLRSNHFHLYVPPEWQVHEQGGDGVLPTLLRIPAENGMPVDLRLYTWVVEGPLADPTRAAIERLAATGAIAPRAAETVEPCSDRNTGFVIFGRAVRAAHGVDIAGMRQVITAGYASGSLVGIVASTAAQEPLCACFDAMHAVISRLSRSLAPGGDARKPIVPPVILEQPNTLAPIFVPPVDPTPPLAP